MSDDRVTTYRSKQIAFDKTRIAEFTEGESGYVVVCLSPSERFFLLSLVEFLTTFRNRFEEGWTEDEFQALHSGVLRSLICPMACQEDIQAINSTLTLMVGVLEDIRDRIGPEEANLDLRLVDIGDDIEALTTAVGTAFPSSLIDDIEPILNGVGVILGAAGVLP